MSRPVIFKQELFSSPEDIWQCLGIFLVVTMRGVLPASSGLKPGVWLNLLQCTGQPPDHHNLALKPCLSLPSGGLRLTHKRREGLTCKGEWAGSCHQCLESSLRFTHFPCLCYRVLITEPISLGLFPLLFSGGITGS